MDKTFIGLFFSVGKCYNFARGNLSKSSKSVFLARGCRMNRVIFCLKMTLQNSKIFY